ncbi:MAG: glycosyltransferase family 2 protein [Nitrosarchaeum sp.]|nr:glycosyltransferase family 2 protein [Nitrosarchaeum sp.]
MQFGDALIYVVSFFGLYTAIYCFLILLETGGNRERKVWKVWPKVCVCVPCFNEESRVGRTLDSLLALNYPKQCLQIIAVDDGSTDGTWKVLAPYRNKGVIVLRKKNGGKHTALNLALEHTDADFGALDADSIVLPDALRKVMSRFTSGKVMAVTPSMKIHKPRGILRRVQSTEFIMGILMREFFTFLGSQHVTPGPFTIFRREFFVKYGKYRRAHLTEDIEMALRIQSKDFVIENASDAYVYTHGPDTFRALYRQRLRWYYGFISNLLDYRFLFSPRKHGNLGLFVLPTSLLSIVVVLTVMGYTVARAGRSLWLHLTNAFAVDFDIWRMFSWNWDAFFVTTKPAMLLAWTGFVVSVVLFLIARSLSGEKTYRRSYIFFVGFYWILYGFWWMAAIVHKVLGMHVSWFSKDET